MLVAIGFCGKDARLCLDMLLWMAELDGKTRHTALLVAAKPTSEQYVCSMREASSAVFRSVTVVRQANEDERGWPMSCNALFRVAHAAVGSIGSPYFLWLEPDCVPLRAGWMDAIESEYTRAKKPFMGAIGPMPYRHLTGVAVYPRDLERYNGAMLTDSLTTPWDVVRPHHVLPNSHITDLIQHEWGLPGEPWTFPTPVSVDRIRPGAMLFHRCKDGSLIKRLQEKADVTLCRRKPVPAEKRPCVVCLGRYGDVMNAMPIALDLAKRNGNKTPFMVSEEFSGILDGISYIEPVVFKMGYSHCIEAMDEARDRFGSVVQAQVYGTPLNDSLGKTPYNYAAWKAAGHQSRWKDGAGLVFDKRDKVWERALIRAQIRREAKPLLLINLTGGLSSPFPDGAIVQKTIRAWCGEDFQVVDLAAVKAERIYDLLALYQLAVGLITVDTSTLHLAHARPGLRLVHFCPEEPWRRSLMRRTEDLSISYRTWGLLLVDLENWIKARKAEYEQTKIVHAFAGNCPENERWRRAQTTWPVLYAAHGWVPFHYTTYRRTAKAIGDSMALPYVGDVIRAAINGLNPNDIVVLTNDDIALLPPLHREVLEGLSIAPVLLSSRRDVSSLSEIGTLGKTEKHPHFGRDLFAARVSWWAANVDKFDNLIIGRNEWDNLVLCQARLDCGTLTSGPWSPEAATTITDCEMASQNVIHERIAPGPMTTGRNPETSVTGSNW